MPTYSCSNGKRIKDFNTKNKLKEGDLVIGKKGAIFQVISQKGGVKCGDTISVKIAPEDYVRNALLLSSLRKER